MKIFQLFIILFVHSTVFCQEDSFSNYESQDTLDDIETYAIVLGVSDYPKLPRIKELKYADDDAIMISDYLNEESKVEIQLYLNEEVTNPRRLGMIINHTLNHRAITGERVIIYFAGHGDINTSEEGYLLLHNFTKPSQDSWAFLDALNISVLKDVIKDADKKGVEVIFIVDACKSGHSEIEVNLHNVIANVSNNSVMMLSSKGDQLSNESAKYKDEKSEGHGVFTYFLVNGLKGLADTDKNGIILFGELKRYVEKNVADETDYGQEPVFEGRGNHEIAVVNYEKRKDAEDQEGIRIPVSNSLTSSRGDTDILKSKSLKCQSLYQEFKKQLEKEVFFDDEMDIIGRLPIIKSKITDILEYSEGVSSIITSNKGAYYGIIGNGQLNIFNTKDFKNPTVVNSPGHRITKIDFSESEAEIVIGNNNGHVKIVDAVFGEVKNQGIDVKSEVTSITYVSSDMVAIGTAKGYVYLWEINGGIKRRYKLHKGQVHKLSIYDNILYSIGGDAKIISFDLNSRERIAHLTLNTESILDMSLLGESGIILAIDASGDLSKIDINTLTVKGVLKVGKEFNNIEIDPMQTYCFIGGLGKNIEIVEIWNLIPSGSKIKNKNGAVDMVYDFREEIFILGDNSGGVSVVDLKFRQNFGAFSLGSQLSHCENFKALQYEINGSIVIGLNNYVSTILKALINEDKIQPNIEEVLRAKRYAKTAYRVGGPFVLNQDKLEINVLLLEIFEVIIKKNSDEFMWALDKVKQIQTLDPQEAYPYNVAARLYLILKNTREAKIMAKRAEEIDPRWLVPKNTSGLISLFEGDYENAEEKFNSAINLAENYADGYANLAHLYLNMDNIPKARDYFKKARLIDSTAVFKFDNSFDVDAISEKLLPNKSIGRRVLCFFDASSKYCAVIASQLTRLKSQYKDFPQVNVIFNKESVAQIPDFFKLIGEEYKYSLANEDEFQRLIGKSKNAPTIIYLEDGFAFFEYYGVEESKFDIDEFEKLVSSYEDSYGQNDMKKQKVHNKLKIGDLYAGGVVFYIDKSGEHGLVVEKGSPYPKSWDIAKNMAKPNLNGFSGWHLPSVNEMNKLIRSTKENGIGIGYLYSEQFLEEQKNRSMFFLPTYWTSKAKDNSSAFWIDITTGNIDYSLKSNKRFYVSVRKF